MRAELLLRGAYLQKKEAEEKYQKYFRQEI